MAKIYPDQVKSEPVEPVAISREQLIYIGPNIPGGVLQRYQVFWGGIPEHAKQIIEKCPAVKSLFVPVDGFAAAEQEISKAGSANNAMFKEILAWTAKGGK